MELRGVCLPSMCKVLGSIPSTTRKEKDKDEEKNKKLYIKEKFNRFDHK
jgi:hypothetical protein